MVTHSKEHRKKVLLPQYTKVVSFKYLWKKWTRENLIIIHRDLDISI